MPSPEHLGGNTAPDKSENSEIPHDIARERGDKTNDLARLEALKKERAKLEEEIRRLGIDPSKLGEEDEESRTAAEANKKQPERVVEQEVPPAEVGKKVKHEKLLKRLITGIAITTATVALGSTIAVVGNFVNKDKSDKSKANQDGGNPQTVSEIENSDIITTYAAEGQEDREENTKFAGETAEGTHYNYGPYADREGKHSYNAYYYDQSENHGDREKTARGILAEANDEPEALASYAYNAFIDEEKEELGIKGLTMTEIDQKFNEEGGGTLQAKLLSKLAQILKSEDTEFKFYLENGTEHTNYMYFVDTDGDGVYTPEKIHLGYDTKTRKDAPQVDIYRTIRNEHGSYTIKVLDLNEECGYQPNYEIAPEGVEKIDSEKPVNKVIPPAPVTPNTPSTPTPNTPTPNTPTPDTPTPDKPTPDKPVPDKPKPKPDDHIPKDPEAEKKNAGEHVTPLPIDNNVTPPTTEKQDRENFDDVAKQREQERLDAEEAARIAAAQAEAEAAARKAAEDAERANEQAEQARAAEEAARKAAEEAAREQQENHDQIQQNVEDERAREAAQEQADERADVNSEISDFHADDTASQRANDFASGNF